VPLVCESESIGVAVAAVVVEVTLKIRSNSYICVLWCTLCVWCVVCVCACAHVICRSPLHAE